MALLIPRLKMVNVSSEDRFSISPYMYYRQEEYLDTGLMPITSIGINLVREVDKRLLCGL